MIERLQSNDNPSFFFLNYNIKDYSISNFLVIPKHFFVPEMIIKRNKGLKDRPNYIMCSINLALIPSSGKIFYIKNQKIEPKSKILDDWQKTLFLKDEKEAFSKGWILDIMNCIDRLGKKEFSLQDIYNFKSVLKLIHPENNNIEAKIRQQLQFLRDKGYLKFIAPGRYRLY